MNYVILVLALLGLVGCYDIARRMTRKTRHTMRAAVILIGIGCIQAMLNDYQPALALLLGGCGLFRICDRRAMKDEASDDSSGSPGVSAAWPSTIPIAGWRPRSEHQDRNGLGRNSDISLVRESYRRRGVR